MWSSGFGRGRGAGVARGVQAQRGAVRSHQVDAANYLDHAEHIDLDLDDVILDLGHLAEDPARGHDAVVLLHRGDRCLQRLHALLLRADHQEIEHDEHEEERREAQERGDPAPGCGAVCGLGISW